METKNIKNIIFLVISLYSLGMCIYSGYTADTNTPDKNSNGLYISSYIICIINCLVYFGIFFNFIASILYNKKENNYESETGSVSGHLLLNIYWLVVYFNYKISDKYDKYALLKTIEFFTILALLIINITIIIPCLLLKISKKNQINNQNRIGVVETQV